MATSTLAKSLRSDPVSRLEIRGACSASAETTVEQIVRKRAEGRSGCCLIRDGGGKLVGIFTERDFVTRVVAAGREVSVAVREVMTPNPKTLTTRDNVQKAVDVMGS